MCVVGSGARLVCLCGMRLCVFGNGERSNAPPSPTHHPCKTNTQTHKRSANKLMKRLEQLKKEKQALANAVEQEEEMISNTLQKRLERLAKDKVELENRLEAEQEYVTVKLQKQLARLAADKAALQRERGELQRQVCSRAGHCSPAASNVIFRI